MLPKEENTSDAKDRVITTEEEMEGFYIVKAILRDSLDTKKLNFKDTVNYFSINYESKMKWLCRLYLNGTNKFIAISNENKEEIRIKIDSIDNIHDYKNQIITSAKKYIST